MTVEEARATLFRVARMRFPRLKDLAHAEKVAALEDYLCETAIARGELEEARLWMHDALATLMVAWDDIEGWEAHVVGIPASRRTQEDVRRGKKLCRPELFAGINSAKHLIARLGDQIRRLEADDAAASREYTIVAG